MKRNRKSASELNASTAIAAGRAFQKHSMLFVESIGEDMSNAHEKAARQLGEMIASATEVCFAIELYLKAIWIRLGLEVPEGHNLWKLFKDIPDRDLKTHITIAYETKRPKRAGIVGLQLALTVGTIDADRPRPEPKHKPMTTLKDLLLSNADGFQTWRYLYEKGESGQTKIFSYPFRHLHIAAEVLEAVAMRGTGIDAHAYQRASEE